MDETRKGPGFILVIGAAWLLMLFLVLPIFVVIPVSFSPERFLSMPQGELSLRHYRELVDDPTWGRSIRDSFVVALAASGIAIVLGTACAIGCWRLATRFTESVRVFMLTPMIVPPIVHALGMHRVWVELGLIDTLAGLILAHAMKGMPFVVISVSAVLANFDLRLEQAARSLGASPLTAVRLTILPNIWPGVLAGGVFAFAISWDEIVVALFLTQRGVYTLPRRIWDGIQDNISPTVAAIGVILVLATILAVLLKLLWDRWLASRGAAESL